MCSFWDPIREKNFLLTSDYIIRQKLIKPALLGENLGTFNHDQTLLLLSISVVDGHA